MAVKRVFLIEDNSDVISSCKMMLEDLGCEMINAPSVSEARELFNQSQDFILIILDGYLIDGDAKELALELRQTFAGPILCNTGDIDMEYWFKQKNFETYAKGSDTMEFWKRVRAIVAD